MPFKTKTSDSTVSVYKPRFSNPSEVAEGIPSRSSCKHRSPHKCVFMCRRIFPPLVRPRSHVEDLRSIQARCMALTVYPHTSTFAHWFVPHRQSFPRSTRFLQMQPRRTRSASIRSITLSSRTFTKIDIFSFWKIWCCLCVTSMNKNVDVAVLDPAVILLLPRSKYTELCYLVPILHLNVCVAI